MMEQLDERMMDFRKEVITGCHHLNTLINLNIAKGGPARYYVLLDICKRCVCGGGGL